MRKRKGYFITFEGGEGVGKSTQIQFAASYLRKIFRNVGAYCNTPLLILREPGSTKIGEAIREILLDSRNRKMSVETELFLYLAARAQLVCEVIQPALRAGKVVICDRFEDSTMVYQRYAVGVTRRIARTSLMQMFKIARGEIIPDLTFLLDVDVKEGLKRSGRKDRMEHKSLRFHERIRRGYLRLAKENPKRIVVISTKAAKEVVKERIEETLKRVFLRASLRGSATLLGGDEAVFKHRDCFAQRARND